MGATVHREKSVKLALWVLLLTPLAYAAPCPSGQAKDDAALVQAEQTWAQALEKHNIAALDCILAEEFEDADPAGAITDRSTLLQRVKERPGSPHRLSEMHTHVYGDVGTIRGLATALGVDGRPKAIVRFTDVYVYRDERWQCVAAHESEVPMERP